MSFLQQPVYSALAALPKPDMRSTLFESYVPGVTPLSTVPSVFGTLALYLAVIFTGQRIMKDRKPMSESPRPRPWALVADDSRC